MSPDAEACDKAIKTIRGITTEPEIGQLYMAKIVRVTDFGAFAEILPNTEGLIHISQLEHRRVRKVTDVVNEGDEVLVKVIDIDKDGRIRLSRKAALPPEEKESD
jgi:polyribonucleotide nucleotidyltransferase